MSHMKSDEELARFFAGQDALEEVSDEDIGDYESRLFAIIQGGRLPKISDVPNAKISNVSPMLAASSSPHCDGEKTIPPRLEGLGRGDSTAYADTRLQKGVSSSPSNFTQAMPLPNSRFTAAFTDNDQRKSVSELENAGPSVQRKRKRIFSPPCPALIPCIESESRDALILDCDNTSRHDPQTSSKTLSTLSGHELETSSIQLEKQAEPRVKVHKKTENSDVAISSIVDASAISSVTTPAATPLAVSYTLGTDAKKISRSHPPVRRTRQAILEEKARKEALKREALEERRMTPAEYAKKVGKKFAEFLERTSNRKDADKKLFLRGKYIFHISNDRDKSTPSTRNKMDILTKSGAVVVPTYDASIVTHIITDAGSSTTLQALGLKSLNEIPMHIPTLTWSWVVGGLNKGEPVLEFLHSAFPSRIDACSSKGPKSASVKGKGKEPSSKFAGAPTGMEMGHSYIEEFTVNDDRGSSTTRNHQSIRGNAHASSSKIQLSPPESSAMPSTIGTLAIDPLSEFYEQARKDRDSEWLESHNTDAEQGTLVDIYPTKKGKSVFTCDQAKTNTGSCENQTIVDKLEELLEIHKTRISEEDRWRVFSYGKAIRSIRNYPKKIESYEEALALHGVGEKTALKIKEIIETGALRRLLFERTEDVQAIMKFKGVYGVGPLTAFKWYQSGCRTLDDVRIRKGGIVVTPAQEIGIKFYDDINSRMPRAEAAEIFAKIRRIALRLDNKLFIEIMGSYRRGKEDCGDIDILVTRPTDDGKTHAGLIKFLLTELHSRGILTEDLVLPDNPEALEVTYRGLCCKDTHSPRRRIDILAVPWVCRGAALLYYTGDDIFNRAIRYKANRMGYSLNQRGLYMNVIRDTNDRRRKLTAGTIIASETEEEIFRILGVPWQEPHERVRG